MRLVWLKKGILSPVGPGRLLSKQRRAPALRMLRSALSMVVCAGCVWSAQGKGSAPAPGEADRTGLAVEALCRLQGIDLSQNAQSRETVLKLLDRTRGTANFLKLVKQFKLPDQEAG